MFVYYYYSAYMKYITASYGIFPLNHDIHIVNHVNPMFDCLTTPFFQAFCCAEFHVGCVVTTPAPAPAAMPYDCHAGYSNWRLLAVGSQEFCQQIRNLERKKLTIDELLVYSGNAVRFPETDAHLLVTCCCSDLWARSICWMQQHQAYFFRAS